MTRNVNCDDWLTELTPGELKALRGRMVSASRKNDLVYGTVPEDVVLVFFRCALLEARNIWLSYELEIIRRLVEVT